MWILILLGLVARLWRFSQVPVSLYWDEVAIGLDARSLLQTGKDLSGHPWLQTMFYSYGDYKAPVYIWLVTALGKFLSVSELTIRLPSLLASLLSAWVLYCLIKLVSPQGSKLPVYTAVSFLIMPWSIHFSRIGMESNLSLFWLVLSVYFIIAAAKKNQPFKIILAALAASLGIYSYISLRLLAPAFFIAAFAIYHRSNLKRSLTAFCLGLIIIFAGIGVLLRSPGYQASQQYRLSNDNLITSTSYIDKSAAALAGQETNLLARVFHHRYWYKMQQYLSNYASHFGPHFLVFSGDPNLRHHSGFGGQLLLIQGIFLILGVLVLTKYSKSETWLIIVWLLLGPSVAALVNEVPHASRAIYLMVPLAWLIGLGINWAINRTPKSARRRVAAMIVIVLTINLAVYLHDYFQHYPSRSALAWLHPYKQAALYFRDNPTDKSVYITNQWYQPGLYFAFYQNIAAEQLQISRQDYLRQINNLHFQLPGKNCPFETWCVFPPDWQNAASQVVKTIPGTDKLVIKTAK